MNSPPFVLIVDDDAPVARMVAATLSLEGFQTMVAHNGEEALANLNGQRPDLIVLDLQMPVMDGRQCYAELRRRGILAPVVILSAYGAEAAQHELGAEGSIAKPFDPDDLIATIRRLLDR